MINNRLVDLVCKAFDEGPVSIFWLSYFKTKSAVSADEFFLALKEVSVMSGTNLDMEAAKKLMV